MWFDQVLLSLNGASVLMLVILTLNPEAPLKKAVVNSGYMTIVNQGWLWCVVFVVKYLVYQIIWYVYYTSSIPRILDYVIGDEKLGSVFPYASSTSSEELSSMEWRMYECVLFVLLSIPIKYILQLIVTNETTEALKQYQMKNKYSYIFDALTGEARRIEKESKEVKDNHKYFGDRADQFNEFEETIVRYQLETWTPWPSEVMELTRLYQLFANVHVSGIQHIPLDSPSLIITNHALGHWFDVPMMVYNIRRFCNVIPRILVSTQHYNLPLWGDLLYKMGGAPRTRLCADILMDMKETIIMFASRRDEQNTMSIWQGNPSLRPTSKRDDAQSNADHSNHHSSSSSSSFTASSSSRFHDMYFDLAKKYNYVIIPAVCVSNDDVVEMVYNLPDEKNQLIKRFSTLRTISQPFVKKPNRSQYHLHFG
ncbi:hypothetical protein RFI_20874 [Reticulomyxa filosa]|uniref:Phospholipid/glycerol acyltransferase domain-containing protein n=1 Tax=Reticulomyxa filosa TaxID=46433 RepID=X6MSQ4_RETFI|nr:hypothetical protein RFI_20874 [Reticulomyxa filosa]|eukprot:ETO16467.1 hypothetical protein RFI_20874 [Reticulomyxa filosa]